MEKNTIKGTSASVICNVIQICRTGTLRGEVGKETLKKEMDNV